VSRRSSHVKWRAAIHADDYTVSTHMLVENAIDWVKAQRPNGQARGHVQRMVWNKADNRFEPLIPSEHGRDVFEYEYDGATWRPKGGTT